MIADKLRAAILVSLLNNESWNRVKLYESATLLSGRDLTKSEYFDEPSKGSIPYITGASNFTPHYGLLINRHTNKPKVIAEPGDVLITCKGTIGAISFPEERVHIARQVMAVRPKNLIPDFLALILEAAVEELKSQAKSMIPGISRDVLLSLEIPVPSIDEQRKVSEAANEIFKALDRLAELEREREDLDRRLQESLLASIIYKYILSGGSTASMNTENLIQNADQPYSIPAHWEDSTLGGVAQIEIGKTPRRSHGAYWSKGDTPWVSIADMKQGEILLTTKESISEVALEEVFKGRVSPAGTLLMSFKLTIGKCCLLGVDAVHNEAIVSIFPRTEFPSITSKYLMYLLPHLSRHGNTKGAIKGDTLNKKSLLELRVPLPPIIEQQHIVSTLDLLTVYLENLRSSLAAQI